MRQLYRRTADGELNGKVEPGVLVPRPAQYSMWEQQRGYTPPAWHGSLIEDKRESLVGLTYRRNRYYDPTSGRFTQEDPIGLAGGLNLYGFANGDPVNFSDPFGLCPPEDPYDGPHCAGWFKWLLPNVSTGISKVVRGGHRAAKAFDDFGQSVDDYINAYDGPLVVDADEPKEIPDNRKPHPGGRPSTREKHEDTRNPSKDKKRQHDDWKQNPNNRPKRAGSDWNDQ